MGKYRWHVSRVNEEPEVVRHYNWITKLYLFVLRNPTMFANKELTIYDHDRPVINMHFDQIKRRYDLKNKETIERKQILALAQEEQKK
ncbi:hypothetical protein [Enterococcus pallens]|nr:hypothetical protein [Enterococcus pallens]